MDCRWNSGRGRINMVKKIVASLVIVMAISGSLYAQLAGDFTPTNVLGNSSAKSKFSLFDPTRLHMNQSYSLMFSSSKSGSSNIAMYLNSIEYQVSNPLTIRFDIGYLHQPGALMKNGARALQDGRIIPAVSINWRPSDNFMLRFDYRQVPVLYNNGGYPNYYNSLWDDR
jgi:hypothetical protein